jgi:RES domain-containing protein
MDVYRFSKVDYAQELNGNGAALYGGRWNKKGTPVLYTGGSIEIALLEIVVNTPPSLVPDLRLITLSIPPESIVTLEAADLPKNWSNYPAPTILTEIAHNWVKSMDSVALKVPSCIVPTAWNYILNCQHPKFQEVRVKSAVKYEFDKRLFA